MLKKLITIVTVLLLVCLKGCIIVEPQVLDFGSETDTLFLDVEPVLISTWGVASSESWLTFYPPGGYTTDTIAVRVERSGLLPGTYTGKLEISGEDSGGRLITTRVRVGMEVVEGWNGNIEGYVYDDDTGEEIQGALVIIDTAGAFFSTTTDYSGYYMFNLIDPNHEKYISATKEGYYLYSSPLQPIGGITIQHDIYMEPKTGTETTTSSSTTTSSTRPTSTSSSTTSIDDLPETTTTTIIEGSTSTTTSSFVIPLRRLQ